jgi:Vitamin K epoxide reductase family
MAVRGRRVAVAVLSLLGLAIAAYLALFQLKVLHTVWDPLPGNGSAWILRRSPLVRWLGFPDAAFGVVAYGAEFALDLWGDQRRASSRPWVVAAAAVLAAGMALGSVGLVALQAIFRHWCFLCLASAAVSLAVAALLAPEVRVAVEVLRGERRTTEPRQQSPVTTG